MITDLEIKTFVENFFYAKGFEIGLKKGARLTDLKIIWNARLNRISVDDVAAVLKMTPIQVQKCWTWFEWIQQGEAEGLTPLEIMLKVNELAAEPAVTELEVTTLLAFFKEQAMPKPKKRRPKKD
jgi:hypothetical protein